MYDEETLAEYEKVRKDDKYHEMLEENKRD